MRRPVTGEVHVHYGQIYVESDPQAVGPALAEAFGGQSGGLCGAAIPGALWLTSGLHTGNVGFTIEVHDQAPPLDPEWEEVVEVSFRPASARSVLVQWAGEAVWELGLDEVDYRARYCASGMDEARRQDTRLAGPQVDGYLLQFWPAPPGRDEVLKQASSVAAYWHDYARQLPPPPTPAERAEAERLARIVQEQAVEEVRLAREKWEWGGRMPSDALRQAGSGARGLLRFDAGLVHALDAAGPERQRTVALLAARRACEVAGLAELDWVAAALVALAESRVLPPPFDDPERLRQALRSDPRLLRRTVGRAIPPERPAFRSSLPPPPGMQRLEPHPVSRPASLGVGRGADRVGPSNPRPRQAQTDGAVRHSTVTFGAPDPSAQVSQPHMALPAVTRAAEADPLRAALGAVGAAIAAYGEHYPALLEELWSACTD